MKCAVGLFEVDKGKVLYDGRNFPEMTFGRTQTHSSEIGMLFQGGALFDSLTVEQNANLPVENVYQHDQCRKARSYHFCLHRVKPRKC